MRQLRESGAYLRPAAGARATLRMMFTGQSLPMANLASIADAHRTVNKVCLGHRTIHRTLRSNAIGASTKSLFSHELFRTIGATCADRALSQNAVAKMAPPSKRAFAAILRSALPGKRRRLSPKAAESAALGREKVCRDRTAKPCWLQRSDDICRHGRGHIRLRRSSTVYRQA